MPKILFLIKRPFYPDSSGGSQHSALYLLKSLHKIGWKVEIICERKVKSKCFFDSLINGNKVCFFPPAIADFEFDYPCWRVISELASEKSWIKFLSKRLKEFRPDVVLGHSNPNCPLLNYAAEKNYLSIFLARAVGHFKEGYSPPRKIKYLANSPFTSAYIKSFIGYEAQTIFPFIEYEKYKINHRDRKYITFINPIPQKGLDIALEIAKRLPQFNFLFVKGKWVNFSGVTDSLIEPAERLPNVHIWENQTDMRLVYSVTDILLMPSQYPETFGRVILEAQLNGIPVVGSARGGIPFVIGDGGIVVEDFTKADEFESAIVELKSQPDIYEKMSHLAARNALRPDLDPKFQVDKFVEFVEDQLQSQPK